MDSTIKRILGEAEEPLENSEPTGQAEPDDARSVGPAGPDDAEIDEVANLWNTGNKGEVIRRFMEMDNEKSVKLVFAIGQEGALEMARMVDLAMEQNEMPGENSDDSTEPVHVEPPSPAAEDESPVRQIMGRGAEHAHEHN